MIAKKSLELYRSYKSTKGLKHGLYEDKRSSKLLALARAGLLPTRKHRRHWEHDLDATCARCGMQDETAKHVVFECNDAYYSEMEYAGSQ